MAGNYYNPIGGQQMYNPMTPYQNRLSQYEQQYPQYNMQNQMQGYQNMPQISRVLLRVGRLQALTKQRPV